MKIVAKNIESSGKSVDTVSISFDALIPTDWVEADIESYIRHNLNKIEIGSYTEIHTH